MAGLERARPNPQARQYVRRMNSLIYKASQIPRQEPKPPVLIIPVVNNRANPLEGEKKLSKTTSEK